MSVANTFKTKLKPVYDWTEKIIMFVCKILLIGDIAVTTISVAGRYIPFIEDPYWSEELVLTQMVYMAVLSATLAIRKGSHIRMTAFDKYLSPRTLLVSDLMSDIAVCVLGLLLLIFGIKLCATPLSTLGRYVSIPAMSKLWQYVSIPVAGAGMIIFELEQIFLHGEALITGKPETMTQTGEGK